jgi:uncharacterized protein YfaS (alpha-2-macroglobulin family)
MAALSGRRWALAAIALVVVGFGAGFLTAELLLRNRPAPATAPVAANGFEWPLFGKPRAADAPRAQPKKPDGFAVWTTRLATDRGSPSACIRMSEALDPRRSYGDFVTVMPDLGHPAAVTVAGDELCVAGVGYQSRTVTLLRGLASASGDVLAANVDVAFEAGSKPPYVGFAGNGVILPREDADGVGIETVNVSRLKLQVWRVADRNLVRQQISAPEPTPEGGYDYEGAPGDDGRLVWTGDMAVQGQADQRATTVFPLGAVLKTLEPGAYVVAAADASGLKGAPQRPGQAEGESPARARRWIIFTDMALQAYDGSDALDVTVRSLKTAKAMGGVRVALVGKDGGDIASTLSDDSGHAHFARALLGGEAGAGPARLMAYGPRGDFTIMDLDKPAIDLSKQDVTGREIPGASPRTGKAALDPSALVDGFVYADRGIYRPGETVHLVALLRDHLAHAVKDRAGALVILRPSGLEFRRIRFGASPKGAVSGDLALPATAPRGHWRASLQMDGADTPSGEVGFQVEDFVPQRLAVTLGADADRPILAGETRLVQVAARFLYGAIASGLQVQSEGRVGADPDPFPAYKGFAWGDQQTPYPEKLLQGSPSVTDGAGRAVQSLNANDLGGATQPLLASFTASVFEPGGRPVSEDVKLKVRLKPLYFGVKSTPGVGDNPLQTFEVIAVDASGRRIAAPRAHYRLISERWDTDWFEKNGRWAWRRTNRDIPIAEGLLDVEAGAPARVAKHLGWGDYRLELDDPATGARTVIRQASGWSEPDDGVEAPDTARVAAVRDGYRTGDSVEVHIQSPFAGEAQVAVATDRLISVKTVTVPKDGVTVRLKADQTWGGGAYVLVTVVQPRDPVSSPKPRRALGLVYVPLDPVGRKLQVTLGAPQLIGSQAPVEVPLTVKGLPGGQKAHLTLAAVDEGILRLTHQKNPDPAGWYFGKRALTLAYRDDYGRLLDPNLGAAGAVHFGGDEVGGAGLTVVPTKSVALWSGVIDTDSGGHATIRLPKADFNGQLRLVAVAWTDDAVGAGVGDMTVREPVVAELALPRFLAPGDRAQATLELHNVDGKPGGYLAQVFGRGGLDAPLSKTYPLNRDQRIMEHFWVTAPPGASIGAVDLKASGPGFASSHSYPLQTRLGWGPVTRATNALQKPGEAFAPGADVIAGYARDVRVTVSYSPFRGFDPAPVAAALSRYSMECSEQLPSVATAALYAADVGAVTGARRPPQAVLGDAVAKLLDREALDGSFGLWRPGDSDASPWLGAYIVDFLLQARAHGAVVPEDAMARALSAMRVLSKPDGFSSLGFDMQAPLFWLETGPQHQAATQRLRSRAAAYALYDMAMAGQGDLARLRWFHDVGFDKEGSPLARAQVGAGLAAMGDRARAHDSFVQAVRALGFKDEADVYQTPLRDLAGVIALAYEAGEVDIGRSLQDRLENTTRDADALNTQEQAYLLRAAHGMFAAAGPMALQASGVQALSAGRFAVPRLAGARVVNAGAGPIWRTVTVTGSPVQPPAANASDVRLEKRYYTLAGAPLDPASLKQGQKVVVRLEIQSLQRRAMQAVIDDPLPAGLEIEAVLRPEDAQGRDPGDGTKAMAGPFAFLGKLDSPNLQDKRDDRYVAAMRLWRQEPTVVAYVARAVTPGDFFLPGAEARDMYRPQVNAHTAAGRMHIAPLP